VGARRGVRVKARREGSHRLEGGSIDSIIFLMTLHTNRSASCGSWTDTTSWHFIVQGARRQPWASGSDDLATFEWALYRRGYGQAGLASVVAVPDE
jgi:hypothetical protein